MESQEPINVSTIIVAFDAPHRILQTDVSADGILGYCAEMLSNRTIQIWHGPSTDSARITSAIKNSAFKAVHIQTNLYDCMGCCRNVSMDLSPCFDTFKNLIGCRVAIHNIQNPQSGRDDYNHALTEVSISIPQYPIRLPSHPSTLHPPSRCNC